MRQQVPGHVINSQEVILRSLLLTGVVHAATEAAKTILELVPTRPAHSGRLEQDSGFSPLGMLGLTVRLNPSKAGGPPEGRGTPALPGRPPAFAGGGQSSALCSHTTVAAA